jgi:AcrR family transcriptional regulator
MTATIRRKPERTRAASPPSGVRLRERLLAAADELFQKVGIRGVGVEAIAAAAKTNKTTLYRHFKSKDDLIAEWVRGIVKEKEKEWKDLDVRHPGDPAGQLQDWSRRTAAKLREMEERGSVLFNALAELPDPEHPARRVIRDHKMREYKRVVRLCKAAGLADPTFSADLFSMLLQGAHSCVQCTGLKQIGEHLVEVVDRMIAAGGSRNRRR